MRKFISVPKDQTALAALDYDQATKDQLFEVTIEDDLFGALWRKGIWGDINLIVNVNIDAYEDEQITDLEDIQEILRRGVFDRSYSDEALNLKIKEIKVLFQRAIDCKTGVFFFF
ncbi:hypothetical protein [Paraflavitalea sp. CAU 1676]|uniref:hypothetical protein n=1 Tax=Paraflavitalea sp. CAU 1676 TaxID=3032598 RepID=UPI0023D9C707|nr:hypothetical protein [Paraflavitalea sp. CAU 1676]MDF2188607.1 hypothetical protein [Paraflavitalea sp. CAU 1676]